MAACMTLVTVVSFGIIIQVFLCICVWNCSLQIKVVRIVTIQIFGTRMSIFEGMFAVKYIIAITSFSVMCKHTVAA